MRKLSACLTALVLAVTVLGTTTTAAADEVICQPGHRRVDLWSVKTPARVTHASIHVLGAGVSRSVTRRASMNRRVSTRVALRSTLQGEVSVPLRRLIRVKVGGTISGEAESWGERTTKRRLSIKDKIPASSSRTRWVAFVGRRTSVGYWDAEYCSSDGTRWVDGNDGNYRSYSRIRYDGIVRCSANAPNGSVTAAAVRVAC